MDLIQMQRSALGILLSLLAGTISGGKALADTFPSAGNVDLVYRYTDDFAKDTAVDDSAIHSIFWVKGAFPPSQPYLVYWNFEADDRAILLQDHQGQPARLGYAIPVNPQELIRVEPLTVEVSVDVQPLSSSDPAKPAMGYLLYMVSADGSSWSIPKALGPGRCQLHLGSLKDNHYLVFMGTHTVLDNLTIEIYRPKADIYVPQDMPTIQQAVDVAKNGDRIIVADGNYAGPGNREIRFKGKDITLISASGPAQCVLDCESQGCGFVFDKGESRNAVVDGFTILNGLSPTGAGIYCQNSSPTIANCRIHNCWGLGTVGSGQGGGIYCKAGSPLILYCHISKNQSSSTKPGLGGSGGGIFLTGDCGAVIEHCTFESNAAIGSASGDKGGGVFMEGTSTADSQALTIRNCLFYANHAGEAGGAIACVNVRPKIINCTVADNSAGRSGGGVSFDLTRQAPGAITLRNSILWGNLPDDLAKGAGDGALVVQYCDIKGGWPDTGNISADPCFARPSSGDYHLLSLAGRWDPLVSGTWAHDRVTSPCIDTGDPGDSMGAESVPNGNRIDMGNYGGTIQASKGSGPLVFHVDRARGSNLNPGLAIASPLATIQKAVDLARDGDAVLVWPGTYYEEVDFAGKAITIQSAADAATVIASQKGYAFSLYHQEGPSSVLRNFVIRDCPEGGVFCHVGAPTLSNLTIVNCGMGIAAFENSQAQISNCILWDNTEADLRSCQARYSCIQWANQAVGEGNIRRTPLFADPKNGDFHLHSRYGRYCPAYAVWVVDDQTSPCIDAGDPGIYPLEEPSENGHRLNMGAYGGTGYSSMSPPMLESDLNHDGIVDFCDMAILADHWLQSGM